MNLNNLKGLNKELHLEFSDKRIPTRKGYGDMLVELGKTNKDIMVLCADLTESTQVHMFRDAYPKQFVEMGVAEQNLITIAGGLAHVGKIPFISSYAMFCPGRCWEQVRTIAGYNESNIKVIGAHSGISVGPDGATHQALEDIATMRVIPGMVVIVPVDYEQTRQATKAIAAHKGPCYMRFAREKTPVITTPKTPFEIGKAQLIKDGDDIALIGAGPFFYECLQAAMKLQEEGINALVLNLHTIKPIDKDAIVSAAKKCGCVVTVEEHQVMGGLGSAVAEVLGEHYPTPMRFIGIQDRYGESGPPDDLIKHFKCSTDDIIKAAEELMKRK
ncbi:MAG: transketolase family protein [Nanoarchaeota archaeon]|nr:transketolase family protein [Nanoarchaeota archaeon]